MADAIISSDTSELKEEIVEPQLPTMTPEEEALYLEMLKAGVLYGRKKSKTNPKMAKYIFATRKGIELFDAPHTLAGLDAAAAFLKEKIEKKAQVLVVGTQPAAKAAVKAFAEKNNFSYVIERWLGGTLTNFIVIRKRIDYYLKIKSDKEAGRLDKYTKKERMMINEQIVKMERFFSGVEKMTSVPEALVIVDVVEHSTAVREAKRLKMPIVGFASSDSDPDLIQYLIPCNDNARSSIDWLFAYLEKKLI